MVTFFNPIYTIQFKFVDNKQKHKQDGTEAAKTDYDKIIFVCVLH